jgi:S1-C subfamily serine protease
MLVILGQITLPNWDALLTKDKKDAVVRIISFGLPKLRSVGDVAVDWNVVTGSGFFIDKNGKIITNSHVVRNGKVIAVILPGPSATNFKELVDRLYFAEVIYDDPDNDIAVIKVTGENFKTLRLSSRDSLSQGEPVAALGYPGTSYHDNQLKVMFGFVASDKGANPISLNMSVNPGNSGGPVLDRNGEVVGVVFAKEGMGREAISYAVPSPVVNKVLKKVEIREFKGKYSGTQLYEAYEELGRGLIKALFFEDYNSAIQHAQKAIEMDDNYAEGHFFYGFLAYKYNAYKIAEREYNTAYKLKPSLFDDNYNKETVEKLLNIGKDSTENKGEDEDKTEKEERTYIQPVISTPRQTRKVEFGAYILRGYFEDYISGSQTLPPDDRMEVFLGVDLRLWGSWLYIVKNASFGLGLSSSFLKVLAFYKGYESLRLEGIYNFRSFKFSAGLGVLREGDKNPVSFRFSAYYKAKDNPWFFTASLERVKAYELSELIENKRKVFNPLIGLGLGFLLEIQ